MQEEEYKSRRARVAQKAGRLVLYEASHLRGRPKVKLYSAANGQEELVGEKDQKSISSPS